MIMQRLLSSLQDALESKDAAYAAMQAELEAAVRDGYTEPTEALYLAFENVNRAEANFDSVYGTAQTYMNMLIDEQIPTIDAGAVNPAGPVEPGPVEQDVDDMREEVGEHNPDESEETAEHSWNLDLSEAESKDTAAASEEETVESEETVATRILMQMSQKRQCHVTLEKNKKA